MHRISINLASCAGAWGNKLLWGYTEDDDEELQKVFNLMVSNGINLFDTADSYGTGQLNGRSEMLLGKFVKEYPGSTRVRNQIHIATKLAAYPWRLTPSQWVGACKNSLKRIGAEKISMAQLHWSTARYAPLQERLMWDGLVAIYEEGLVDAVGLSNYGPKQLQRIHSHLSRRGVPIASVQIQYSLLSRGKLQEEAKAACDDLNIAMIAYSPLALGMLTGRHAPDDDSTYPSLPNPRSLLFRQIVPEAGPLFQAMREIGENRNKTMSQVAINWCMCKGTIPIPGARNLNQAQSNLGALGWRLSDGECHELEKASDMIPKGMTQNIFQTR
jgi:pyridoxine 4-dehydrogenase